MRSLRLFLLLISPISVCAGLTRLGIRLFHSRLNLIHLYTSDLITVFSSVKCYLSLGDILLIRKTLLGNLLKYLNYIQLHELSLTGLRYT